MTIHVLIKWNLPQTTMHVIYFTLALISLTKLLLYVGVQPTTPICSNERHKDNYKGDAIT